MKAIAIAWLVLAAGCAAAIVVDILRGRRQPMAVMNVVWPITALYAGPIGLWAYWKRRAHRHGERSALGVASAVGATHCGAGCTLADIVGEWVVALLGLTLLGRGMFAAWALDLVLAFAFGIAFQYFAIVPMRGLSPGDGLVAAIKADTLSLAAWQVGMYGFMAWVVFALAGHEMSKTDPRFWFAMQLAMGAGFLTSWPVNAWLIRKGVKEAM